MEKIIIGIDPGVQTGIASWSATEKRFYMVDTMLLHNALSFVENISNCKEYVLHVRFEDARKRKYFGNSGREKLQGAGSVKRDSKIWEDFLTDKGIKFDMPSPKDKGIKVDAAYFKKLTGWFKRTSQHARDAAMLVYGL